jgi:hypothetical protein
MDDREVNGFLDAVLEPVEFPAFGTTGVPLLDPNYQDVWLGRPGDTRDEYIENLPLVLEYCLIMDI